MCFFGFSRGNVHDKECHCLNRAVGITPSSLSLPVLIADLEVKVGGVTASRGQRLVTHVDRKTASSTF